MSERRDPLKNSYTLKDLEAFTAEQERQKEVAGARAEYKARYLERFKAGDIDGLREDLVYIETIINTLEEGKLGYDELEMEKGFIVELIAEHDKATNEMQAGHERDELARRFIDEREASLEKELENLKRAKGRVFGHESPRGVAADVVGSNRENPVEDVTGVHGGQSDYEVEAEVYSGKPEPQVDNGSEQRVVGERDPSVLPSSAGVLPSQMRSPSPSFGNVETIGEPEGLEQVWPGDVGVDAVESELGVQVEVEAEDIDTNEAEATDSDNDGVFGSAMDPNSFDLNVGEGEPLKDKDGNELITSVPNRLSYIARRAKEVAADNPKYTRGAIIGVAVLVVGGMGYNLMSDGGGERLQVESLEGGQLTADNFEQAAVSGEIEGSVSVGIAIERSTEDNATDHEYHVRRNDEGVYVPPEVKFDAVYVDAYESEGSQGSISFDVAEDEDGNPIVVPTIDRSEIQPQVYIDVESDGVAVEPVEFSPDGIQDSIDRIVADTGDEEHPSVLALEDAKSIILAEDNNPVERVINNSAVEAADYLANGSESEYTEVFHGLLDQHWANLAEQEIESWYSENEEVEEVPTIADPEYEGEYPEFEVVNEGDEPHDTDKITVIEGAVATGKYTTEDED